MALSTPPAATRTTDRLADSSTAHWHRRKVHCWVTTHFTPCFDGFGEFLQYLLGHRPVHARVGYAHSVHHVRANLLVAAQQEGLKHYPCNLGVACANTLAKVCRDNRLVRVLLLGCATFTMRYSDDIASQARWQET